MDIPAMNDKQETLREHLKIVFDILFREDTLINDFTIELNTEQDYDGIYVNHIPTGATKVTIEYVECGLSNDCQN